MEAELHPTAQSDIRANIIMTLGRLLVGDCLKNKINFSFL